MPTRWILRIQTLRERRRLWLLAVNLRIVLGFAFLPAGLKKVLGEPFTDPTKTGPFHDFLHAFRATGIFYHFVGLLQVTVAFMLMSQRLAALGAILFLPVITAILVFCWSTAVYPTAAVVTLMFLGGIGLVAWDVPALCGVEPLRFHAPPIAMDLWSRCGLATFAFYLVTVALNGGVYRPRGFEPDNPAFWTLPALVVFPIVTWLIERRRRVSTNVPGG